MFGFGKEPWPLLLMCVTLLLFVVMIQQVRQMAETSNGSIFPSPKGPSATRRGE